MKNMILAAFFLLAVHSMVVAQPGPGTPPLSLKLFLPGLVSTHLNERDFALSPDGSEIYFTVSSPKSTLQTIVWMKWTGTEWTRPEVVSFAGNFSDLEPAFAPDGKSLYFSSNRPRQGVTPGDFDIWMVSRVGNGWSSPVNIGSPVNTEADEFYPSLSSSGNLYFTAQYKSGIGKEDIYFAERKGSSYSVPVPLDTAVNTRFYEFNAFVAPDESYILFTSYGRADDMGGGDLYISRRDSAGKWQRAQNLKELNSRQLDYCPYVSPDGRTLFITSERHSLPVSATDRKITYSRIEALYTQQLNGTGNIYWIGFNNIGK